MHNCIVVNSFKSNFLSFNASNLNIIINGYPFIQTSLPKYLGLYIDDKLLWTHHVSYVTKKCCQRIGILKKVLPNLPNFVLPLHYNAFISSGFSYCLMLWFNNNRSGRFKLIDKIDNFISMLNRRRFTNLQNIDALSIVNVWSVFKYQYLSCMYDLCNKNVSVPFFPLLVNNMHLHITRSSTNIHINHVCSLDIRNFVYNSTVMWNNCPIHIRSLLRSAFLRQCKLFLNFVNLSYS